MKDKKSILVKGIGLLLSATILFMIIIPTIHEKEEYCTDAVITDIIESTDSEGNIKYNVYMEYDTEDGVKEDKLDEYSSDMKKGDIVEIDCKIEAKYDLIEDGILGTIIVMILFYIGGIYYLGKYIYKTKKEKLEKKLIQEGLPVLSSIIEIRCIRPLILKTKSKKYSITCNWIDSNNKEYMFMSKMLLYNPEKYLKEQNIIALNTYINEKNPKQYIVDTRVLEELRQKDLEEWKQVFRKYERQEISIEEYSKKRKEIYDEENE